MEPENRDKIQQEISELRNRVQSLEREAQAPPAHWQATGYYGTYYGTTGFLLGGFAAIASLLFNILGSLVAGLHPLRIIQVYLTFPLGEKALTDTFNANYGVALAIGCCLYIATGCVLGVIFQMAFARFVPDKPLVVRLVFATVLGLIIWAINFYAILSWVQPALFDGNWITDPSLLPPWVAAATHVVFAWTMAVLYPYGAYHPYRPQTELA